MLKFTNKKGKKVMEVKDDGSILIEDAKLEKELALQEGVVKKEEEKKEDK